MKNAKKEFELHIIDSKLVDTSDLVTLRNRNALIYNRSLSIMDFTLKS